MNRQTDFEKLSACIRYVLKIGTYEELDSNNFDFVKPFLLNLKAPKERPDGYAIYNNDLLILEHFEFDNSRHTNKGSKQQQTYASTERELSDYLSKSNDTYVANEYLEKTGRYYIENFRHNFISHYKKIKGYKENLRKELGTCFNKIYVAFAINDNSCLGSFYRKDGQKNYINLLYSKEFLDIFEQNDEVDFVFFTMLDNQENKIAAFISRSTINEHRDKQYSVENVGNLSYSNVMVISFDIPIKIRSK